MAASSRNFFPVLVTAKCFALLCVYVFLCGGRVSAGWIRRVFGSNDVTKGGGVAESCAV